MSDLIQQTIDKETALARGRELVQKIRALLDKSRQGAVKFDESKHPRDDQGQFTASGEMATLIDQIRQPDGGFTVHTTTGQVPTTGFAISLFKGRETIIPVAALTLEDLVTFAKQNRDLLEQDDNYFGAWHNPDDGKVYMDVSKVVQEASDAERLGQEHHQIAYFDLAHGQSITVGKKAAHDGG